MYLIKYLIRLQDCCKIQMLTGAGMSCLRGSFHGGRCEGAAFVALRAHGVPFVSAAIEDLHVGAAVSAVSLRSTAYCHSREQRLQPEEELCAHRVARTTGAIQQPENAGAGA